MEDDWTAVADIYWDGMRDGLATFETEVPNWEQWDERHLPGQRIVAEFLHAKRGGSYLIAGTVKRTAPEWSQTHDVLQCPSASGG